MFSSVFCTDSPCQLVNTKHAFKDDLVHTTVLDTFVSMKRIPTHPIGWLCNPSRPTSYFCLLLEFRLLLDTNEELWPLSCYGPRREQEKCNMLLHLFSIDSAPLCFQKIAIENLYTFSSFVECYVEKLFVCRHISS